MTSEVQSKATSVLAGLIGRGIDDSRTPEMHEEEGRALGMQYVYRRIDLDRPAHASPGLDRLISAAEWLGFSGLNVTHPCKQSVIPLLDAFDCDAEAIGAVNTIVFGDGRRVGYNTDMQGFQRAFQEQMPHADLARVVQLGCGGAGAAVAHAMMRLGAGSLVLVDAAPERARALASRLRAAFGDDCAWVSTDLAASLLQASGIVNATPVGMRSHLGTPIPVSMLRPDHWFAELIYFPLETELLRAARSLGCRTMDGGAMAVFQAVESFRLFTGVAPDSARMRRHFAALGER